MSNLACITCHYNYNNFQLPKNNLHAFLERMENHKISVYGVELILPNQKPETENLPNWRQIKINPQLNIMWQKEAILNLAEKLVPNYYENIAWVDADIIFLNKNWANDTVINLQKYDIIQLYEKAHRLNIDGEIMEESDSIVKNNESGTSGFAWAMKRSLWKKINGLYDRCIAGGGDLVMANIFLNIKSKRMNFKIGNNLELIEQWRLGLKNSKVGYLPNIIYHEYHGSIENRQYVSRNALTRHMDLCNDIKKNNEGIFQWNKSVEFPVIYNMMKYFLNRKEDL
jgi:hypothetical protein